MKKQISSLFLVSLVATGCSNPIQEVAPTTYYAPPTQNNVATYSPQQNIQQPISTTPSKAPVVNIVPDTKIVSQAKIVNSEPQIAKRVNIGDNYNTTTLLVGLRSQSDLTEAQKIFSANGLTVQNNLKGINTIVLSTSGQNVTDVINKLSQDKIFSFVETDTMGQNKPENESDLEDSLFDFNILNTPQINDKLFSEQYGLTAINAPEAWTLSTGKNAVISVIDTGVDMKHQDLKNRVTSDSYDAFSKKEGEYAGNASKLNYISSTYKHGSHVAGIISAEYNNTKGIAGVAPESKVLPVKVFPDFTDYFKSLKKNEDGSEVTVVSAIADGIVWSVDHKADVINMSLAVWSPSATIERAIKYALDNNVSVVVAAGNDRATGNKKNYLAAYPGVIGVGATDKNNEIAFFSNSGDYVSVAAPGYDIVSTTPSFLNIKLYRKMSGTSMAAPHVAGVVALMKSKFGAIATPSWIKSRLEKTSTDLGAQGRDDLYGHGLINAYKALNDPIEETQTETTPVVQ